MRAPVDLVPDVLLEAPGIRQRSRLRIAAGALPVEPLVAAAVVVLIVGSLALSRPLGVAAPTTLPSQAPVITSVPTSGVTTPPLITMPPVASWVPFVATVNGYSLELPADWSTAGATQRWPYGEPTLDDSPWTDVASAPDGRIQVFGRVTETPVPMTLDAWIADYEGSTTACATGTWDPVTNGSLEWRVREFCGRFVALAVDGTSAYVLSLRPESVQPTVEQIAEDRRLFEGILASFRLLDASA